MPSLADSLALVLYIVLSAYWGQVAQMVIRARRRTGRSANVVPAEQTGRRVRLLWTPVIALWVVTPLLYALHVPFVRPGLRMPMAIRLIAVATAVLALLATMRCWRQMGTAWRMGIDPGEKNMFIASGPYAWVRHPIYALSQILMLCSVLIVPTLLMCVLALIHISLLHWEARREEAHMLSIHGPVYRGYCQRVGRFVPFRYFGR